MNNNDGTNLAKVLWYYNLLPDINSETYKIVCPFHDDVNPSMIVNLKDGSWFCFGCNETGNSVKFVKLMESKYNDLNDLQSYKKYVRILKSSKCSEIKINSNIKEKTKLCSSEAYNEAHDYYYGLSKINWKNSNVEEVIKAKEYMKERGFTEKSLQKCKAKITYNKNYGIIFPMLDNDEFKGWVCRTMIKEVEKKRKYLYNTGFSRASTLVGNYGSKKYVFVVEGYMDRLKFIQNGEENVVAILGWKMSNEQINKLKKSGITDIISALDNDKCGKEGTEYLKKFFNVTRFAYLKGVKDPGDMNKINFDKMFRKTMKKYNESKVIRRKK